MGHGAMPLRGIKSKLVVCIPLTMFFVLFMLSVDCWGQDAVQKEMRWSFDGKWWQMAKADEQTGFLYALDDCLTFDRKPPLKFDDTWINYERKISSYYALSPSNRTTSVQHVFERFGGKEKSSKGLESMARYGSEFWRAHSAPARLGFIEGFISCRAKEPNPPKWSKPMDYYLQQLNDLYNVDDRHGEDSPEYAGSVASALEKNSDRP